MSDGLTHELENAASSKKVVDKKALRFFPLLLIFFETTLYLSNDMYLPSMPAIEQELNLTQNQTQATLISWFIGASSLQLILGPLSDRFGRKLIVAISCLLFIVSSAACALSDSLTGFLLARFVQGSAICSLLAAYAAIHELYDTKQAIKLLAIVTTVTILAPALGPLIGALIVQFAHWSYIFWLLSAMGILSFLSIIFYMPESNFSKSSINVPEIIRDYGNIITNKEFLFPSLSYFLLIAIEFAWIFESPFIIIEVFKASPLFYGVTQTIIFSFYFLGIIATKWILDHYSILHLINISLYITLAGTLLLLFVSIFFNSLIISICCIIIISFGSSMLFGPLNRIAIEACKEPMGRRTAIFSNGISLAGVLIGWVLALMNSESLLAIALLMLVCISIAAYLIYKTDKTGY